MIKFLLPILISLMIVHCSGSHEGEEPASPEVAAALPPFSIPTPRLAPIAAPSPTISPKFKILMIGQSNMSGRGEKPYTVADPKAYNFVEGKWVHLVDPYSNDSDPSSHGSLAPSMANTLIHYTGETVGTIPAALGGTNIIQWSPSGELYLNSLRKARIAHGIDAIVMNQGEADMVQETPANVYKNALRNLIKAYRADLRAKVPFFIVKVGFINNATHEATKQIRHAQQAVADEMEEVYIAADDEDLPGNLIGCCHYDTNALNILGETVAVRIYRAMP